MMGASYSTSNLLVTNSYPPQGLCPRRVLETRDCVWVSESLPKVEPQFFVLKKLNYGVQEEHTNAIDHYMSFHPQDTLSCFGIQNMVLWVNWSRTEKPQSYRGLYLMIQFPFLATTKTVFFLSHKYRHDSLKDSPCWVSSYLLLSAMTKNKTDKGSTWNENIDKALFADLTKDSQCKFCKHHFPCKVQAQMNSSFLYFLEWNRSSLLHPNMQQQSNSTCFSLLISFWSLSCLYSDRAAADAELWTSVGTISIIRLYKPLKN